MDECKVITDISGAVITTPIARSMPLSFYDSKYGMLSSVSGQPAGIYSNLPQSRPSPPHGQQYVPPNTVTMPTPGMPQMPGIPAQQAPPVYQAGPTMTSPYGTPPGRAHTPPSSVMPPHTMIPASSSPYMTSSPYTMVSSHSPYSTQPSPGMVYTQGNQGPPSTMVAQMGPPGPRGPVPPQTLPFQSYGSPTPQGPPQQPQGHRSPHVTPGVSPRHSPQGSPRDSPMGSPNQGRRGRYVERSGSQPLLSINDVPVVQSPHMDRADSLPVIPGIIEPERDTSLPFPPADSGIYRRAGPLKSSTPPTSSSNHSHFIHQRSGSAPLLTPGIHVTQHFDYLAPPTQLNPATSDSDLHKAPPPKPSRIPSVKYQKKPKVVVRNIALYEDDDRDYSDYGQVKSDPSWVHDLPDKENRKTNHSAEEKLYDNNFHGNSQSHAALHSRDLNQNVPKGDSRKVSDTNFNVLDGKDYADVPAFPLELNLKRGQSVQIIKSQENKEPKVKVPNIETGPSFDLHSHSSVLLPNENKLLEPSVLIKVRDILLHTDAKLIAKCLTSVDLDLLKVTNDIDLGMKVTSGLELLTLPQGKQLRQDILER